MDSEHRELLIKTWELIETTRHEISQLRDRLGLDDGRSIATAFVAH